MKLKNAILFIVSLAAVLPLAAQPANQQNPQDAGGANTGQANPQVRTVSRLSLVTLEDFEEAEDWRVRATSPLGETKLLKMVQRGDIRASDDENSRPPQDESYSVVDNPDDPNHILGVKTYFYERGFDRVEVSPPHEYTIKGKARQFSIWVLGRKFRHTLSIKLRDYRGKIHKLNMGRLDFFGWKKLVVTVPGWLPQSTRYSLMDRNLHFVSLFVTSDTHEIPGTFYFYVDGLKALVDQQEQEYPGSEIKDNW